MSGQVNQTLVRQFRMPAYPLVLITTDLLQEGEDLHLFCSNVYRYGIAWMPSSMEQRLGGIDRVRSQTERRLTALTDQIDPQNLLQVYYPFLRETVEVFQVNRVLDRMARFIQLMHEPKPLIDSRTCSSISSRTYYPSQKILIRRCSLSSEWRNSTSPCPGCFGEKVCGAGGL